MLGPVTVKIQKDNNNKHVKAALREFFIAESCSTVMVFFFFISSGVMHGLKLFLMKFPEINFLECLLPCTHAHSE